jgi:hypothetical protein
MSLLEGTTKLIKRVGPPSCWFERTKGGSSEYLKPPGPAGPSWECRLPVPVARGHGQRSSLIGGLNPPRPAWALAAGWGPKAATARAGASSLLGPRRPEPGRGIPDGNRGRGSIPVPGKSGMGMGMFPAILANRGWDLQSPSADNFKSRGMGIGPIIGASRPGLSWPGPGPAPDPEIPNSRSPDSRFGRETGREFPIPDRPGIGNRESGNAPFPDSAGKRESGSRLAANREIGDTLRCEYSCTAGLDVASKVLQMQILASPHLPSLKFFNCQGPADGGS